MKILQVIDYKTFGKDSVDIAKECEKYCDIIWFRIKDCDKVFDEAEKMRKALPKAFLSLSLDADIASELAYDAVHLGELSDLEYVRSRHPYLKIGYSAHSVEDISNKSADYYTLSPIFMTQKDYEVKPIGVQDVTGMDKEIYALGGINLENAQQLNGKGYAGVAGISFYKELSDLRRLSI